MVWTQGAGFRLAPALLTLLHQLEQAYPGPQWQGSPQTGTIGDAAHRAETNSDHNPWLDGTVRALDVAVNVHGVPGIVDVADGPPGEALFAMVNGMFAARDTRVHPNGYAIFNGRITDWNNPGQPKPYDGPDAHHFHVHISVSTNPLGYDSTAPWPLPAEVPVSGPAVPITSPEEDDMPLFIRPQGDRATVGLLLADGVVVLRDAVTVHTLLKAGVKDAGVVSDRDFAALLKAAGQ